MLGKMLKSQNRVQCFAPSFYRGSANTHTTPLALRVTLPGSSPRELLSASQHQAAMVLNCVCEHLCFILGIFEHDVS